MMVWQSQELCELQVDDVWYRWSGAIEAKSSSLSPGRTYEDIRISFDPAWHAKGDHHAIQMSPGKHTVTFDFKYDGPGIAKGGTGVLSVDGNLMIESTPNGARIEISIPKSNKFLNPFHTLTLSKPRHDESYSSSNR
jgi:hypothetical protein